jgi:hypothetical protein
MASRERDKVRSLVCDGIAIEWVGPDPDAAELRRELSSGLDTLWQRADWASAGGTSRLMTAVLAHFVANQPPGPVPAGSDPAEQAARQLARLLLGFLPAEARSLGALVANLRRPGPGPSSAPPTAPVASGPPDTEEPEKGTAGTADEFDRLLTDPARLAAAWPSAKRMAELIKEILDRIKKLGCLGGMVDVATWETYVLPRMATSYAVATAVQQAFSGLNLTGVVSSNISLGNTVHSQVAQTSAAALAPMIDRYLVADHNVYRLGVPSSVVREAERTRLLGELSLTLLASSRGESDPVGRIRGRGRQTSRDDLVVFFGPTVSNLPGPFASGRPEVWEVKPIRDLQQAVSQVSAYSLNYLAASFWARCKGVGGARIDNSIMLPGSPEAPAIPVPSISVTGMAAAASGPPPVTAAQVAQLVQQFLTTALPIGSFLAIPFMISGLYGIIPYFVLDLGKLAQLVQVVLEAIISALIQALLAYLAAKKLLEELAEAGLVVAKVLAWALLFLIVIVAAFLLAAAIIAALPEVAVLAVVAGVLLLVFGGAAAGPSGGQGSGAPGSGGPGDATTLLDINLGPVSLQGVTAAQLADLVSQWERLFIRFWRTPDPGGGAPNA